MDRSLMEKKTRLTFASSFRKPALAVFTSPSGETELVRVSHVGDAEGSSPVYNIVDDQGQSAWVPQAQVKIIDQDYLPISRSSVDAITQNVRGLSGTATAGSSSSR